MLVDRLTPPLICAPTKGVTSMPFWAHTAGAVRTVQAIAANRRFVFKFVPSSALLFQPETVARSAILTDPLTHSNLSLGAGTRELLGGNEGPRVPCGFSVGGVVRPLPRDLCLTF